MTTRINLLPWRAERRRVREREFYTMLGGAAIAGVLGVFLWSMITGATVDNQTSRNSLLTSEIAEMDKRIEQIKELDKTKSRLIGRKNAIELLQANRSQMVHLLDELVVTIPDGVRLIGLKQVGEQLTLEGIAESNTRVATYMRNIDRSPWMGRSEVSKIENRTGMQGADARLPYQFSLNVRLLKAGDQKSQEDIAAAAAAADMAEGIQLAPGDMRVTPGGAPDTAATGASDAAATPATETNPAATEPAPETTPGQGMPAEVVTPRTSDPDPAATSPPEATRESTEGASSPTAPAMPVPETKPGVDPTSQEPSR
ncbi:MAG: PilN domain-containing protein [Dokdonella sp.]